MFAGTCDMRYIKQHFLSGLGAEDNVSKAHNVQQI